MIVSWIRFTVTSGWTFMAKLVLELTINSDIIYLCMALGICGSIRTPLPMWKFDLFRQLCFINGNKIFSDACKNHMLRNRMSLHYFGDCVLKCYLPLISTLAFPYLNQTENIVLMFNNFVKFIDVWKLTPRNS